MKEQPLLLLLLLLTLIFPRPAFGGKECEGPDVEADLCHRRRVGSCSWGFLALLFTEDIHTIGQHCLFTLQIIDPCRRQDSLVFSRRSTGLYRKASSDRNQKR